MGHNGIIIILLQDKQGTKSSEGVCVGRWQNGHAVHDIISEEVHTHYQPAI